MFSQQLFHRRFLSTGHKNRLCVAASHSPTSCGRKRARVHQALPSSSVLVSSSATRPASCFAVSLANQCLLSSGSRATRNFPSLSILWIMLMVWLLLRSSTADLKILESTSALPPTPTAKTRPLVWWLLKVSLSMNGNYHPTDDPCSSSQLPAGISTTHFPSLVHNWRLSILSRLQWITSSHFSFIQHSRTDLFVIQALSFMMTFNGTFQLKF